MARYLTKAHRCAICHRLSQSRLQPGSCMSAPASDTTYINNQYIQSTHTSHEALAIADISVVTWLELRNAGILLDHLWLRLSFFDVAYMALSVLMSSTVDRWKRRQWPATDISTGNIEIGAPRMHSLGRLGAEVARRDTYDEDGSAKPVRTVDEALIPADLGRRRASIPWAFGVFQLVQLLIRCETCQFAWCKICGEHIPIL